MAGTARPGILIVDDEALSLQTLRRTLDEEFEVFTAGSAAQAQACSRQSASRRCWRIQRMPEQTGVAFLTTVREQWPEVVRMIISGYTDPDDIIDGINGAGIYQFISKPWHPDSLFAGRAQCLRVVSSAARKCADDAGDAGRHPDPGEAARPPAQCAQAQLSPGRHRAFTGQPDQRVCDQVAQIAPYDISVLLDGESGTGKELFARAIHYNSDRAGSRSSPRTARRCLTSCSSELFGHKRGAFHQRRHRPHRVVRAGGWRHHFSRRDR